MDNKTITFGRSSDNTCIFSYPKISSHHCRISKSHEGYIIEDLNSSNGTFVNDTRIRQMLFKADDTIKLADYLLNFDAIRLLFEKEYLKKNYFYDEIVELYEQEKKQKILFEEFKKLHSVYTKYIADKKRILQNNTWKATGLRVGLSLIPVVGNSLATIATGASNNAQVKLIDLEEQFKKDFVCPSCLKFLGSEPFDNLLRRKSCGFCKAKWVEE